MKVKIKAMVNRHINRFIAIFFVIGLALFIILGLVVYRFQKEDVSLDHEQLNQSVKYVMGTIKSTIESNQKSLRLIAEETQNQSPTIELVKKEGLSTVFVVTPEKKVVSSVSEQNESKETVEKQLSEDKTFDQFVKDDKDYNSGEAYFLNGTSYIDLYQKVYDESGNLMFIFVAPIDLEKMYLTDLASDGDRLKGYAVVKNQQMELLMHPVSKQIGMHIIRDRKKEHPTLDFSGLEKLEKEQLSNNSGRQIYYSYWWSDKNPKKILKISAFEWMDLGLTRIIVSIDADYMQQSEGIIMISIFFMIILSFTALITVVLYLLRGMKSRQQTILNERKIAKEKEEYQEKIRGYEREVYQYNKVAITGLLTTSIVHDMNNFLTPIVGMAEMLIEENEENPALVSDLSEIVEEATRGQKMVRNIMRFSRKKTGNTEVKAINIVEKIQDEIALLKFGFKHHITLKYIGEEAPIYVLADEQDLTVLMDNLITNAYQAISSMPKKDGEIFLSVRKATPEELETLPKTGFPSIMVSDFIVLSVTDTGPGMPKEIVDNIFAPFFTTKTSEEGTGLGLFVVSALAEKYDWTIRVTSELSTGSTFSIFMLQVKEKE
ncbi:MAG: HAMP domain-containing histidine kinase [Lactobacillales bacterium]|jgi:signal transduction histidine kinase|nr:HAMP domain-containing histidine kinase [Lactobacillales bacterium]